MEYLKTQVINKTDWDRHLKMVMFSYNTSVHESTRFASYELVFGKIPRLPSSREPADENLEPTYHEYIINLFNKLQNVQAEARGHLMKSKEKNKYYYDQKINPQNFKEGDYVFLLKEPQKTKFSD